MSRPPLQAFENQTKIKGKWKATPNQPLDGAIDLYFAENKVKRFIVAVKKEIRNYHVHGLPGQAIQEPDASWRKHFPDLPLIMYT